MTSLNQLLMDKQAIIILNLAELADFIEARFGEQMIPYAKGYYLRQHTQPTLVENSLYYQLEFNKDIALKIPVRDPSEIKSIVYDAKGKEVFDPSAYSKKIKIAQLFSKDAPTEAYRGFELLCDFVSTLVYSRLSWGAFSKRDLNDVLEHFFPGCKRQSDEYLELHETISNNLNEIREIVLSFMGQDTTHDYDFKRKGLNLYVTKLQDYRIYEYEKLKEENAQLKAQLAHIDHDDFK